MGGGGGGGTGDGEGSRGVRCPPLSEELLTSGLYVCVRGAGWAMVAFGDRLKSSDGGGTQEISEGEEVKQATKGGTASLTRVDDSVCCIVCVREVIVCRRERGDTLSS